MLEPTKVPAIDCFKALGEGIESLNKELDVLKTTLVHLSAPFGLSFFQGNFACRERYQSLACDDFDRFLLMLVNKLEELNFLKLKQQLLQNNAKVI
jgi:hypothetical protein